LRTSGSGLLETLREVRDGWRWHELWFTLGWRDVQLRHRRSRLGPFWISLSMAFVAVCMGAIYSAIMQAPAHEYVPYLVTGFMTWNLLSAFVTDGKDAFVGNASAIKEIAIPGVVYVYRLLWRNLLVFGYSALVYIAVLLVFQIWPFPELLWALPALVLILLNGVWLGLLLGLINVRYRDFGHMIPNAMRLMFFITPILWYADRVEGPRALVVYFNPAYYMMEVLRAPLLGQTPAPLVWAVAIGVTIVGWGVTLPIYAYWRRRINFWI